MIACKFKRSWEFKIACKFIISWEFKIACKFKRSWEHSRWRGNSGEFGNSRCHVDRSFSICKSICWFREFLHVDFGATRFSIARHSNCFLYANRCRSPTHRFGNSPSSTQAFQHGDNPIPLVGIIDLHLLSRFRTYIAPSLVCYTACT